METSKNRTNTAFLNLNCDCIHIAAHRFQPTRTQLFTSFPLQFLTTATIQSICPEESSLRICPPCWPDKDRAFSHLQAGQSNALERQLLSQMQAARRLYTEMEILARLAIDALADNSRSRRVSSRSGVSSDGSVREVGASIVHRLEEEYRAKVVELESKMSTAQLQVHQFPCQRPRQYHGGKRI